jgi:hypothetical protein
MFYIYHVRKRVQQQRFIFNSKLSCCSGLVEGDGVDVVIPWRGRMGLNCVSDSRKFDPEHNPFFRTVMTRTGFLHDPEFHGMFVQPGLDSRKVPPTFRLSYVARDRGDESKCWTFSTEAKYLNLIHVPECGEKGANKFPWFTVFRVEFDCPVLQYDEGELIRSIVNFLF